MPAAPASRACLQSLLLAIATLAKGSVPPNSMALFKSGKSVVEIEPCSKSIATQS